MTGRNSFTRARPNGRIAASILDRNADEAERLSHRHMEELVKPVRKLGPGLVDGVLG